MEADVRISFRGSVTKNAVPYRAFVVFDSDKFPETVSIDFVATSEHLAHVTVYKRLREYIREVKARPGFGAYNGFMPKYTVTPSPKS